MLTEKKKEFRPKQYFFQLTLEDINKYIQPIENVQRRAAQMIPQLKNKTLQERHKTLKLPTLAHRRIRGFMIEA